MPASARAVVARRVRAAAPSSRQQRQAGAQDRRLHLVEPRVHAELAVVVAIGLAAVAQPPDARGDRGVAAW